MFQKNLIFLKFKRFQKEFWNPRCYQHLRCLYFSQNCFWMKKKEKNTMVISNLHLKALTCASFRASHHTRVVDQDVNLRILIFGYQSVDISLWISISGYRSVDIRIRMIVSRCIRISDRNHLGETSWDLSTTLLHTPQAAQVQPIHLFLLATLVALNPTSMRHSVTQSFELA